MRQERIDNLCEKRDKKDRSKVYTVKGVFNYGEYIRLANPISVNNSKAQPASAGLRKPTKSAVLSKNSKVLSEKEINVKIDDVKICKYGSGLLFQLVKGDKGDKIDIRDQVKKLNKKEQKIIDMKGQRSIDDAWN